MNDGTDSQIPQEIKEITSKKHKITQENFDKAMKTVKERPAGDYLAEKLSSKLRKFVNKELSADEWGIEVQKAYKEILRDLGQPTAITIMMSHPIEAIVMAIIWAIPY
jgi:flagellar motor switch protein FliM